MTEQNKGRLLDIDRAKGFGIAMVVWGHLFKANSYGEPEWLQTSRVVIYEFHMPFFMYLSGFVFFFTASHLRFFHNPGRFVSTRFDRLMVPFLLFGLIVVLGKFAASSMGDIDDPVDGIGSGLWKVVTNAADNPSISIWYLLVLFVYSVTTPLLWRFGGARISVILALGLIAWLLPLPDAFYLKRIGIYFLFFGVGGLIALYREILTPWISRLWLPFTALLALACYIFYGDRYALLFCGLASIPAIHGLFMQRIWKDDRIFLILGRYSMAIYLMNTIFIGLAKVIYVHILPYRSNSLLYIIFALTIFLAGLLGPMMVKLTLDRIRLFRPIARYLA